MSYNVDMPRVANPKTDTGRVVLRLRKDRGWSQAELAKAAGLSKPTVQRVESGPQNAERETLERIAKALGVPVTELLPVHLEESKAVLDSFLGSDWGKAAQVTEAEKAWILSAPLTLWIGHQPSAYLVFRALEVYRQANAKGAVTT